MYERLALRLCRALKLQPIPEVLNDLIGFVEFMWFTTGGSVEMSELVTAYRNL